MGSKLPNVQKPNNHRLLSAVMELPRLEGMRTVIQSWALRLRFWGAKLDASRTTVTIEGASRDDGK